jgi:phosphoglycolate phosphatase
MLRHDMMRRNLKYEIDLLIFDLDGTLVDTRRDLANAVNYALKQTGRNEIALEMVVGYVGDGTRKLLERTLGNVTETELEIFLQHFRQYYFDHIADFSRPYDGTIEVLDHFAMKKKAVLTNKPQEFADELLQRLEICKYFEIAIGAQPNLKLKPDSEGVLKILHPLEVQPARAMIIGDSENDILAGKAARILTCAVTFGFRPAEKLLPLNPDFFINEFLELKYRII